MKDLNFAMKINVREKPRKVAIEAKILRKSSKRLFKILNNWMGWGKVFDE